MEKLQSVIICGSNSKTSRSQVVSEFLCKELSIWTLYLNTRTPIPNLNNEIIQTREFPSIILLLLEKIKESQILIFVVSQYNYNFSGFFKNVLDWCSLYSRKIFYGKRIILIGCSSTTIGEEEFQRVGRITFSSLGAEEIIFLNTTEVTNLTELATEIRKYV